MGAEGFQIDTPPALADKGLQSLYDYWRALGEAAGGLPSVQDFDPLRLPKLIPNLWILEIAPDTHRFRMRLAGENINVIYHRNIGGRYFSEVFQRSEPDRMIERYTRTLSEPSIVCAAGAVYELAGRFSLGERLAMPMLGRTGITDTMLGATVYDERILVPGTVQVMDNTPVFYPVRAANHRPPQIVGG